MKKIYSIPALFVMLILASCSSSKNFAQSYYQPSDNEEVTYQQFYDDLSPYGNWFYLPGHGYVWSPYESGFQPYETNGHWAYTQMGWTWVSGYRWGWAPFHYGRWMRDRMRGWLWLPGYEWAPAWVAWRGGGGYYGWAPLGPGMSINISIGAIPYNNWCFVPSRYITHSRMDRYFVRRSNNVTIINNTTIINNNNYYGSDRRAYNSGPRVMDVERQTRQKIAPIRVVDRSTPGNSEIQRGQIAIYRPEIKPNANTARPGTENMPIRKFQSEKPASQDQFQNNGISHPVNPRTNVIPVNPVENVNRSQNSTIRTFPQTKPVAPQNNAPVMQNTPQVRPTPERIAPKREFKPVDDRVYNQHRQMEKRQKELDRVPERRLYQPERQPRPQQQREVKPPVRKVKAPIIRNERPESGNIPQKTEKRVFRHF